MRILYCENKHYFVNSEKCPICGLDSTSSVEYREGDCIDCGQLCPGYAYGCTSPSPLVLEDINDQSGN